MSKTQEATYFDLGKKQSPPYQRFNDYFQFLKRRFPQTPQTMYIGNSTLSRLIVDGPDVEKIKTQIDNALKAAQDRVPTNILKRIWYEITHPLETRHSRTVVPELEVIDAYLEQAEAKGRVLDIDARPYPRLFIPAGEE